MAKMMQNNFSGGVLSPSLYGRSDLQSYYKGCASAKNFIVAKEGTLRKRRGFVSLFALDNGFGSCKIVPYQFDRTQAGFLILSAPGGEFTAKLYNKTGAFIDSSSSEGFSGEIKNIQAKQIGDQIWITNGSFFKTIKIDNFSSVEITDWKQAEQPEPVKEITALGYTSSGSPYNPSSGRTIGYAAYIIKDGVMSKIKSIEKKWDKAWVAGYWIDVEIKWDASESFDYVMLCKKTGGSYGEVSRWYPEDIDPPEGETYSATFRDENISAGTAVYNQTNILGENFANPVCVDCFQQRKVFANAENESSGRMPMTMFFSEVGNLDNFYANRPASDSDAFSPTISSTGPAFIRWLIAYQEALIIFTDSGLFSVGFSQTQGFSASTCRISKFSNLTASPDIQPVVTDAGVVFVATDSKTVYTVSFDLQENMMKPVNRSVMVEHLTRTSRIVAIALQSSPDNVVWVVTEDGKYCTFTFERNEEVYAWSHGEIEGCAIKDVVSLGSVTDSNTDRTYGDLVFVVNNGSDDFVCVMKSEFKDNVGGVSSNVASELVTLRPESQERTIVGVQKNVKDVILRLYKTGGIAVKSADGGQVVPLVDARMTLDEEGLFTGEVKVMPRGIITPSGQMTYLSDNDKPCEILQILTSMEVEA